MDNDSMGLAREERIVCEKINIDEASEYSEDCSFMTDDALHVPLSEDEHEINDEDGSISKNDSVFNQEKKTAEMDEIDKRDNTKEELLECCKTIEALRYQNALNLSRLEEYVTKEEEWMKKLNEHVDIEDKIVAYKQEAEELRKELKVKKKFVFSMQVH